MRVDNKQMSKPRKSPEKLYSYQNLSNCTIIAQDDLYSPLISCKTATKQLQMTFEKL